MPIPISTTTALPLPLHIALVTADDVATFARCENTPLAERRHARIAMIGRSEIPVRQLAEQDAISLHARVGLLCHVVVRRDAERAAQLAITLLGRIPHPPDVAIAWPNREVWESRRRDAAACAARRPLQGEDLATIAHTGALLQAYVVAHQRDRASGVLRTTTQHKFLRDVLATLVGHLEALLHA